ncbi:glycoside hydrolase family 32 protein [Anaerobranca gottschalkii]|uniref:Sucrose-6-phosphate hydrolase n=1 Tax=Anaerobranca gottschalkii DSM 13577 TaxID=1120990 RepID=A0A1I0C7R9_9FIRM|nr:sucrose-6-phosphate hydrolase [Anaerobranca gottschalkii]SET14835.1 beta-fructofuranosidase [Anaerobranca gottschalkii DSM 13577]
MKSYRQSYHLSPPYGFMNDPNGLSHFKGRYHVFYQWNKKFPLGKEVHWGHFSSKDMVFWYGHPSVLAPVDYYDKNGCYSGSAIQYGEKLLAFYTGNVKTTDGERETYQCLAISEDGDNFVKYGKNPLINNFPPGYTAHFRDPKVWQKDGMWYMIIGAQREDLTGTAVLYKGNDPYNWSFVGEVSKESLGYMWECPDLFSLDDKDILLFCPQGLEPQGDLYNNRYQCGYMIGKLDYNNGKFHGKEFIELDRGFEFYAPQTFLSPDGRRILWAWMGMPEEEDQPTLKENWIHCLTIPRELYLKGEKLCQKPIGELERLRVKEYKLEKKIIQDSWAFIKEFSGERVEIQLEIVNIDSDEFGLFIRSDEGKKQYTKLTIDTQSSKVILDREKSGLWGKGQRAVTLKDVNNIKITIYIDTSSLEIFLNEGEETFTVRIFPNKNSTNFGVYSKGGKVEIVKGQKWDLKEAVIL